MATKTKMKLKDGPSEKELAERNRERFAANRTILREAAILAQEAFSVEWPTTEMTVAVSQMIEGGVERENVSLIVRAARAEAEKLGARDAGAAEVAIQILDVLLDDDEAEEHLAEARDEARRLFGSGVSPQDCLTVYLQIYAEDEA